MAGIRRVLSAALRQHASVVRFMTAARPASSYVEQYAKSIEDVDAYWGEMARELVWQKPFDTVSNHDLAKGQIRWFEGGQLNVAGLWLVTRTLCDVDWSIHGLLSSS